MAVTINASTTAGLVQTADTSGVLALQTAGTTAVTVDASQNVGIGTTTLTNKFNVAGAIQSSSNLVAIGVNTVALSQEATYSRLAAFGPNASTGGTLYLYSISSNGAVQNGAIIDASGNLLLGTTDSTKGALIVGKAAPNAAYGQICAFSPTASDSATSGMSVVKYANDSTTAQVLFRFLINQGAAGQGQINGNGANAAAFGSYSDARLKENIVDLPSQLANIMALRPVEFDYIESEGGGHQIGFVAQEVKEIYPDLVGEDADGMYTLSDMNKNDARLIKAIQEMKAIIDTQASTITQLQADVAALKGALA